MDERAGFLAEPEGSEWSISTMAQFLGLFPRSYPEAREWLAGHEIGLEEASRPLCTGCRLYRKGEAAVSVQSNGLDIVTWMATGRIKINTKGRNDSPTLAKINACLPDGYRVTKKGGAVHLDGPAGNVAVFLSSTIIRVGPDPEEQENTPSQSEAIPRDEAA